MQQNKYRQTNNKINTKKGKKYKISGLPQHQTKPHRLDFARDC